MKDQEQTVELQELQVTAKKPVAKPETDSEDAKWEKVENSVSYVRDGKKMYSTADKLKDEFKDEYEKVPDEKVRENILREKYQLKRHGTQQVANKAQMDVLKEKAKGSIGIANHTPRKSAWEE